MNLLPILQELGLERLRESRKEISAKCPAHKRITGHDDNHPSWSISKESGLHICYSCGWRGGLEALFQEVRGSVPHDLLDELTVVSLQQAVRSAPSEEEEVEPDWDWEHEQSVSVPVPTSLREHRHLTAESLEYFGVRWNRERAMWMLPFTRPDGTVFGAQYRAKGSELNLPVGVETKSSLFGIHKMVHTSMGVTLVESPLDAVRLWQVGVAAVASYGSWVSEAQVTLLIRHFTQLTLALDQDDAGLMSTHRLERSLTRRGFPYFRFAYPTSDPNSPEYRKDPGEFESDDDLWQTWKESFNLFGPISKTVWNER